MVRDKKKKRVLYNVIDDLLFLNSPSKCPNNCVYPDKPCPFKYELKCPWKWGHSGRNDHDNGHNVGHGNDDRNNYGKPDKSCSGHTSLPLRPATAKSLTLFQNIKQSFSLKKKHFHLHNIFFFFLVE
jgi:hypothetical protein